MHQETYISGPKFKLDLCTLWPTGGVILYVPRKNRESSRPIRQKQEKSAGTNSIMSVQQKRGPPVALKANSIVTTGGVRPGP